jgi:DNA-binding transcriptional LysR family regulator
MPACSPALAHDRAKPLAKPDDLRAHVLLHDTYVTAQKAYVDWEAWFAAVGIRDPQPAGALYFNQYDQMIQAAVQGQGVALGISPLVHELLRSGLLVAPFTTAVSDTRACFIVRSTAALGKPQVDAFVRWLLDEARRDVENGTAPPQRPVRGGSAAR